MSFLDLLERGAVFVEAQSPSSITICGTVYACAGLPLTQMEGFAMGYRNEKVSRAVYVRKTVLPSATLYALPKFIGLFVTLDCRDVKIEHFSEDESGWEIFLSDRSK